MQQQTPYFHAFNSLGEKIGPVRFKKLSGYFHNAQDAWSADVKDLVAAGLEENLAQEISLRRKNFNVEEEFEKILKQNIEVLTIEDENYPPLLREIYSPPYILYKKGEFSSQDNFSLAIVGSRKLTSYGQQVILRLARDLAQAGLTIVSGLALGIDALAHRQTLEAKGRTIAVLGSGIDETSVFPTSNRRLAQEIINQGVVLSEYPPGTLALRHHFPARNRIISGLSLGTLVVEAAEKSGALITARHALEQNREVFAVPGPITSKNSIGPNNLIKLGAKAVTDAQDVLEEFNLQSLNKNLEAREILPDTREEALVLGVLQTEPVHIDKIAELTTLDAATINSVLSMMEIKGKIKNLGGMNYVRAR